MNADGEIETFPGDALALVLGASGAIGGAVADLLRQQPCFGEVLTFSRSGENRFDLTDETSIAAVARRVAERGLPLRLVFDATGVLHAPGMGPERSLQELDPERLAASFALNAIGPALLMKHLLPVMARRDKAVFAALSARVGSIGDNRLGGWYGYRASKAALNQIVRTAAIEWQRRSSDGICVALHPGTVRSPLSEPFAKTGLNMREPEEAARLLLEVIDSLSPRQTGGFFDVEGQEVPW